MYRVLGTPNEDSWPGVTTLQDWNEDFPVWPSLQVGRFTGNLSESGVDLCEVCTHTRACICCGSTWTCWPCFVISAVVPASLRTCSRYPQNMCILTNYPTSSPSPLCFISIAFHLSLNSNCFSSILVSVSPPLRRSNTLTSPTSTWTSNHTLTLLVPPH